MTYEDTLKELCRVMALAYRSIGDYSYASDGVCLDCPNTPFRNGVEDFRNDGKAISFVRLAVLEKLKRDGYKIHEAFNPETGEEITDANPKKDEGTARPAGEDKE